MAYYILSIDQGTTSSRSILFDLQGNIAHVEQQEFEQYFPEDGRVEHKPDDIWQSVVHTTKAVVEKIDAKQDKVIAIGIANQRETTLVWDRKTGVPIYNAIVWQDRRTSVMCEGLKALGKEDMIRRKTGLLTVSATQLELAKIIHM